MNCTISLTENSLHSVLTLSYSDIYKNWLSSLRDVNTAFVAWRTGKYNNDYVNGQEGNQAQRPALESSFKVMDLIRKRKSFCF